MPLVITRDVEQFAAKAEPFLAQRLERNVIATVLIGARTNAYPGQLFAYGEDPDGELEYVALRAPPWPLLASELDARAARDLIQAWLQRDSELAGVSAVPDSARSIAAAWSAITGGSTELKMAMAMHSLQTVTDPPRPAPGTLRPATAQDRSTVIGWMEAFNREAGVSADGQAAESVDRRMQSGGLLVWEDGEPVSFLSVTPPVAGVVRIGPVYTPPEQRRRGYAGTAVAAASRGALAAGASRCMLFTDLTNPTSNKIYAEVGYRRCGGWEEHHFSGSKSVP